MIATVRDAVENLYLYLRPEQRGFPPTDSCFYDLCNTATSVLNGAMQEFCSLAPLYAFRRSKAHHIRAPKTFTLATVPVGGRTLTIATADWESWMLGCSISISGQEDWNEVLEYDVGTETALLLNPLLGAGGSSLSATIYHDSLSLDSDVLEVISPVGIADRYELAPADGLSTIKHWHYEDGYGDYGMGFWRSQRRQRQTRGTSPYQPQVYFVDTYLNEDMQQSKPELRMRLAPMPDQEMILQYRAKLEPPRFTSDDVYDPNDVADPPADPGILLPVPNQFVEAIYMPIARQRWTGVPYFRNDSAIAEISRQYEVAMQLAKNNKPQSRSGHHYGPHI